MGRMKDIYIDIMNANNGEMPTNLTIQDVGKMYDLKIYNWKEYEKKIKAKTRKLTYAPIAQLDRAPPF